MRAVLQRVSQANVKVDDQIVGQISIGWMVLLGVGQGDGIVDLDYIIDRIVQMRAFADEQGKMNLTVQQVRGSILLISQFTLYGDLRSRRPGFKDAASPEIAKQLYEAAAEKIRDLGVPLQMGIFAADMKVSLLNDGPVTFFLDSKSR